MACQNQNNSLSIYFQKQLPWSCRSCIIDASSGAEGTWCGRSIKVSRARIEMIIGFLFMSRTFRSQIGSRSGYTQNRNDQAVWVRANFLPVDNGLKR